MEKVFVGVGQASLLLRYARTGKDKHRVVQGLVQKLRNLGFSVAQAGYEDVPQRAVIAFTYVHSEHGEVENALDSASRVFVGDFELVAAHRDVLDYSGDDDALFDETTNSERYE